MDKPTVRDLILQRLSAGSSPANRDDPWKLALAIEGGGMRGVVLGGMVTALGQMRVLPAIDTIFGTSAGAFAGAYLAAGQPGLGTSIYLEDLSGKEFIDQKRFLIGQSVMNLDYLVEDIVAKRKPLSYDAIMSSGVDLRLLATSVETGKGRVFGDFTSQDDLLTCLKASATMPIIASRYTMARGEKCVDGGLVNQIPWRIPVEQNYTHVLVLLPRARSWMVKNRSLSEKIAGRIYSLWGWPELGAALSRRRQIIFNDIEALRAMPTGTSQSNDPTVEALWLPEGSYRIGRLEKSEEILLEGAKQGSTAVIEWLTGKSVTGIPVVVGHDQHGQPIRPLGDA